MKCNTERLIQALVTAQLKEQQAHDSKKAQKIWEKSETHVVTISRKFGSSGRDVAQLLSNVLKVRCCDRYILQEVARRANLDEELVKVLDEHISHIDDHWWKVLLARNNFSYEDYYKYLVKTVFSVSLQGGVIVGRGANFILGRERAFRVRIVGSPVKCAERIAKRERISLEKAIKKAYDVDRERAEYIQRLYETDINDPVSYDLVLNSDRYDRIQLVELIIEAMKRTDYRLPPKVFNRLKKLS